MRLQSRAAPRRSDMWTEREAGTVCQQTPTDLDKHLAEGKT
jgi:hypothetical protein